MFYHGSKTELSLGLDLIHQYDDNAYTHLDDTKWLEDFMERERPEDKLSRRECVFLAELVEDIDNLGGYDDHVYEAEPEDGYTEKSDLSWYTRVWGMIGDFPSDDLPPDAILLAKQFAHNYWHGIASDNPVWEFRCRTAKIVRDIDEEPIPAHKRGLRP